MKGPIAPAVLFVAVVMLMAGSHAAAAPSPSEITIDHAPPSVVLPGLQINLTAVLTNATLAVVTWNNGTLSKDAEVPMTNTSERRGSGWVYEAWLPAQADGVQVSYAINASNGMADKIASYFLVVSAPSPQGLTAADQFQWILTVAASLSMAISTMAVLYWYFGRRLRKEG